MKKKISFIMIGSLVMYALFGFADGAAISRQTTTDTAYQITLIDQQLLTLAKELNDLKAELAALYALNPRVVVDDNIKDSDDDEDDDEDDDDGDDDSNGSDDDYAIDGMSNATTSHIPEEQLLRESALKLKIETVEKQIRERLSQRDILVKSIEVKMVSSQVGSAANVKTLGLDSIQLKGKTFKFDTAPIVKEGRTLVPVRAFTEGLGATVSWEPVTQTITIQYEGKTLVFKLKQKTAWLNGKAHNMEVVAESIDNRTYVPIRFIAEQLGFKVNWQSASQTIELVKQTTSTTAPVVTTPPVVVQPPVVQPTEAVPPVDTVSGATRK